MNNKQTGFVSIIVTMIVIVLVTMIALSFALLARQNSNQGLNSQLSTQAYYAAESGVNEAVRQLKAGSLGNQTTCANALTNNAKATLDASKPVKYTCVLVSQSPKDLRYSDVSTESSTIVHVRVGSGQPDISTLQISWQSTAPDTARAGNNFAAPSSNFYLPQKAFMDGSPVTDSAYNKQNAEFPNYTGILRATIIPTSAANSADNLYSSSQDLFLYPRAATSANNLGSVQFRGSSGPAVSFVNGNCDVNSKPYFCNVKITGINTKDLYLRLKGIYHHSQVQIRAFSGNISTSDTDTAGNRMEMVGSQAVVDATGRAVDTVRRIQVRVPLEDHYRYPEYAIESGDSICKIYSLWPGGAKYNLPDSSLYSGPDSNNAALDRAACALPGSIGPPAI
jgi:hypothetical protein